MTVLDVQDHDVTLRLSIHELVVINNALNEVCNGIEVPEFRARIGAPPDQVQLLSDSVSAAIEKVPTR
jgi:hypothetical protein